jgi:predicted ATPase
MLKSIQVSNFRSLRETTIRRLQRLNLITGRNGGGKTSLLEAVFLNSGGANASLAFSVNGFRGENLITPESDSYFRSMFSDLDTSKPIQINCDQVSKGKSRIRSLRIEAITRSQPVLGRSAAETFLSGLRFRFSGPSGDAVSSVVMNPPPTPQLSTEFAMPTTPPFNVDIPQPQKDLLYGQFISPYVRDVYAELHAQLVELMKVKGIGQVIETVNLVESNIKNIVPIVEHGRPIIYVDTGRPRLLPISSLGSGFLHVLRLSLAIGTIHDGIIIIDELEDGLHYSVIPKIARLIFSATRSSNVQFFVSTHSNELLKIFIEEAQSDDFTDMCLVNFTGSDKGITTRYFDRGELDFALELDAELR